MIYIGAYQYIFYDFIVSNVFNIETNVYLLKSVKFICNVKVLYYIIFEYLKKIYKSFNVINIVFIT